MQLYFNEVPSPRRLLLVTFEGREETTTVEHAAFAAMRALRPEYAGKMALHDVARSVDETYGRVKSLITRNPFHQLFSPRFGVGSLLERAEYAALVDTRAKRLLHGVALEASQVNLYEGTDSDGLRLRLADDSARLTMGALGTLAAHEDPAAYMSGEYCDDDFGFDLEAVVRKSQVMMGQYEEALDTPEYTD